MLVLSLLTKEKFTHHLIKNPTQTIASPPTKKYPIIVNFFNLPIRRQPA